MDEVARFLEGDIPIPLPLSNPFGPSKLALIKHKAHSEEVVSKNGIQKPLHTIVKNSPYHLQIGAAHGNKVDFSKIAFESFLLYDTEVLKEVDFVKIKPMDFKSSPIENGQYLDVELRIKVLTSQHEDMLFRVRIQGYNPVTREELIGMSYLTPSIKVISKPEQLKKKIPSKKRSLTDMLVETVSRIEKKQEEQQRLIERMLAQQSEQLTIEKKQRLDDSTAPIWDSLPELRPIKTEKQGVGMEFEEAFSNLIKAYNTIQAEEKPGMFNRIIDNSSTRDVERISELLDLFWMEGLRKEFPFGNKKHQHKLSSSSLPQDGCSCIDCPHKQELERIDEFYKEFLSSGLGMAMPGY